METVTLLERGFFSYQQYCQDAQSSPDIPEHKPYRSCIAIELYQLHNRE